MSGRRILLAGATGLIGSAVLECALADARIGEVIVLTRKPLGFSHAKLEERCSLGADLLTALRPEPVDAVICCLGTTIRNVGGDQRKFMHVDKDLVVGLARWAKAQAVGTLAIVSAIGADADSRIFYNRTKGEMEREVIAFGIPATHLFQPSILTGPRKEVRTGERIGITVTKLIAPLMIGSLRKYRPMPHDVLAQALINVAIIGMAGAHRHTYDDILKLALR